MVVVAVLEVGLAESLQRSRLFRAEAKFTGDGERLSIMLAGFVGVAGAAGQLREVVQRLGFARTRAEVTVEVECLPVAAAAAA